MNVLTLHPAKEHQRLLTVYEVVSAKQSKEDEWMYQLAVLDTKQTPFCFFKEEVFARLFLARQHSALPRRNEEESLFP